MTEAELQEALQAIKDQFPDMLEVCRHLYNAGMIDGLRAITWVRLPDGREFGEKEPEPRRVEYRTAIVPTASLSVSAETKKTT